MHCSEKRNDQIFKFIELSPEKKKNSNNRIRNSVDFSIGYMHNIYKR